MLRRAGVVMLAAALLAAALLAAGCGGSESGSGGETADSSTTAPSITATSTAAPPSTSTTEPSSTTITTTTTSTTTSPPPAVESTVVADYTPAPAVAGDLVIYDAETVSIVTVPAFDDAGPDAWTATAVLGPINGWEIDVARATLDGSIVVGLVELPRATDLSDNRKIVQFHPDGSISELASHMVLYDVGLFGGVEMVMAAFDPVGAEGGLGTLLAIPTAGGPPVAIDGSYDAFAQVVGLDAVANEALLTEAGGFRVVDDEGGDIGAWADLALAEYGPEVRFTASPDGSELVWVDWAAADDASLLEFDGNWVIASWDRALDEQRLFWPFDFAPLTSAVQLIDGVTHTGEMIVVSRGSEDLAGEHFHLPLLVLDLRPEEPELYVVPLNGVVDVVPGP